jgi:tetratricopeptide (TPR) repeat protein
LLRDPGNNRPVTAASLPKPDPGAPASEPSDDGWVLLEGLRRKLDDQAAQGRTTQHQVSQLAESIAALVEAQRRRNRRLNLNSFVAYLIFTMLCGTGFYLLYRTRANELVEARDHAQRERDIAVRRSDEAATRAAAREQADTRAWEVYQLLEAGKRSEATGKLAALGELPLSRTQRAILAARAHETQVVEVDAALKAAAAAYRAGHYTEVIAPLEAALVGEPAGTRAAAMRYFLGIAYAKGNQLDKAIAHLQGAVVVETDQEDVRFQLASALDRSGAYAKARIEYDRFATAHPQSPLALFAMRRSATLARMPAIVSPPAGPPGAPAKPPAGIPGAPPPAKPPAGQVPAASPSKPPAPAKPPPTGPAPAMPRPPPGPSAPRGEPLPAAAPEPTPPDVP